MRQIDRPNDEAAQPFGEDGGHRRRRPSRLRTGRESTLVPMILSFAPSSESTPATALAMSVPTLVALLGYALAALPGERYTQALRVALLVGWLAQGAAIVVDVAGLGAATGGARLGFAPALSITLWLVQRSQRVLLGEWATRAGAGLRLFAIPANRRRVVCFC